MKRIGMRITSLCLASFISLSSGVFSIKKDVYANDQVVNAYEIDYIKDDSLAFINDNYDEQLASQYRSAPDDMIVDIPNSLKGSVANALHKNKEDPITVGDLRSITNLTIFDSTTSYIDISWLNYCSNLQDLNIYGSIVDGLDSIQCLDGLVSISLGTISNDNQVINLENCGFLKHSPKFEKLVISSCNVNPEQLYLLDIDILEIDCSRVKNIDFRKLNARKKIIIYGHEYDIAVNLTNNDIDYLRNKGIEVEFKLNNEEETRRVNDRLDEMLKSMDIDANASDEEKTKIVIRYMLDNFHYDEEIARKINNGTINYHDDLIPFYYTGDLYGALEKDKHVCGNYSSFLKAMLNRLGIDAYTIYGCENGGYHSWNLVCGDDGKYYYYDAVVLDHYYSSQVYDSDEDEYVNRTFEDCLNPAFFYKLKPGDYFNNPDVYDFGMKTGHKASNFPISIVGVINKSKNYDQESVEERIDNEDNSIGEYSVQFSEEDDVIVRFDGKLFIIPAALLIAIMSAFGLVHFAKRRNETTYRGDFSCFGDGSHIPDDSFTQPFRR